MSDWQRIIKRVQKQQQAWAGSGCDSPFYRGHRLSTWKLLPGLGRGKKDSNRTTIESTTYYDFFSLGGPLFPPKTNSWDVAFAMQHHGLPTRLLDWTHTFAVALYFAIAPTSGLPRTNGESACVWMLNPFDLNHQTCGDGAIFNPEIDLKGGYYENFIVNEMDIQAPVMAINPNRSTPRQAAQRSVFTLHKDIWTPLEIYAADHLHRIEIPEKCIPEAMDFLRLAGINEYTLFPDFDGLARHLKHEIPLFR